MPSINIRIFTDNEAFANNSTDEIARILRELADNFEESAYQYPQGIDVPKDLFDVNGNLTGQVWSEPFKDLRVK